ncbi:MAG: hypothetical protein DRN15_05440 [Thermoprotei archaeon]|nr:MAG: hypothetical protein DRM97_06395 [Thermoprotei archaeon]RLF23626.1 MAG: hypothetical protein DRN15_05440 [Thermoprotei archaeon]
MVETIKIEVLERWRVVYKEDEKWQCGIYSPEFSSKEEVSYLERHNAPELFLLIRGEVVLLLSKDGKEVEEVRMKPGIIYIVEEWHNAYSPKRDGVVLVIERPDIKTEYIRLS